jgi:cytoskeletal protein RodZ
MSQAKVEKYKEAKANRKKTMKKEKMMKILRNSIASVVVVAVVGWIGYSGVTYIIANQPRPQVDVDYTAVSNYETELQAEEKTDDAKTDTEKTAE